MIIIIIIKLYYKSYTNYNHLFNIQNYYLILKVK